MGQSNNKAKRRKVTRIEQKRREADRNYGTSTRWNRVKEAQEFRANPSNKLTGSVIDDYSEVVAYKQLLRLIQNMRHGYIQFNNEFREEKRQLAAELAKCALLRPEAEYQKRKMGSSSDPWLAFQTAQPACSLLNLSLEYCNNDAEVQSQLNALALTLFAAVHSYITGPDDDITYQAAKTVMDAGLKQPLIRDEIYAVLLKQAVNENRAQRVAAFKLLFLALCCFLPSDTMLPYVESFLATALFVGWEGTSNQNDVDNLEDVVQGLIQGCFYAIPETRDPQRLVFRGVPPAPYAPSLDDIEQLTISYLCLLFQYIHGVKMVSDARFMDHFYSAEEQKAMVDKASTSSSRWNQPV